MAKRRHDQPATPPPSSRNMLLLLTLGGLLVAGLVAWALTRTVEPDSVATTLPTASAPGSAPTATYPLGTTDTGSSPMPSATAPATGSIGGPLSDNTNAVNRVAAEDLREKLNRGEVMVIDVRDEAAYATSHIAGAVNIPFGRTQTEMGRLPKGKPIVTYCT